MSVSNSFRGRRVPGLVGWVTIITAMIAMTIAAHGPAAACWQYRCGETTIFTTVCTWDSLGGDSCETTIHSEDRYCCEPEGPPPDGPGSGGGGGSPPSQPPVNPKDTDGNGSIDCWPQLMDSTNASKDVLDENQKLGTDYGGTNSVRPDHTAIDMDCNLGDPVYAGFSGIVETVGFDPEAGNKVRIQKSTDSRMAAYAHLQDSSVTQGQAVTAGITIIGHCNHSGSGGEQGDHLHYEVQCGDASNCFRNPETEHPCVSS